MITNDVDIHEILGIEPSILTDIYVGGHRLFWCGTCRDWEYIYSCCKNSTCSGSGCDKCKHVVLRNDIWKERLGLDFFGTDR